jgi:hypothetical protein
MGWSRHQYIKFLAWNSTSLLSKFNEPSWRFSTQENTFLVRFAWYGRCFDRVRGYLDLRIVGTSKLFLQKPKGSQVSVSSLKDRSGIGWRYFLKGQVFSAFDKGWKRIVRKSLQCISLITVTWGYKLLLNQFFTYSFTFCLVRIPIPITWQDIISLSRDKSELRSNISPQHFVFQANFGLKELQVHIHQIFNSAGTTTTSKLQEEHRAWGVANTEELRRFMDVLLRRLTHFELWLFVREFESMLNFTQSIECRITKTWNFFMGMVLWKSTHFMLWQ